MMTSQDTPEEIALWRNTRLSSALMESIEHWQRHATSTARENEAVYAADCALCKLYRKGYWSSCEDCPVRGRTGYSYCLHTPHQKAAKAWEKWNRTSKFAGSETLLGRQEEFEAAAFKELEFLRSLHPAFEPTFVPSLPTL